MPALDGPPHDLPRLIDVLDRHEVEYLIVGGAAAYAYGAERPTEDADCVVGRDRANLDRLAAVLRELNARLRVGGMTDAGPFDVLAGLEAPDGHLIPYEELVTRATLLHGDGFTIRAAALDDIIRAKERADRAKDREALPELRALRDRHSTSQTEPPH